MPFDHNKSFMDKACEYFTQFDKQRESSVLTMVGSDDSFIIIVILPYLYANLTETNTYQKLCFWEFRSQVKHESALREEEARLRVLATIVR